MKLENIGSFVIFFVQDVFQVFLDGVFVQEFDHLDEAREFSFFETESNETPRFDW